MHVPKHTHCDKFAKVLKSKQEYHINLSKNNQKGIKKYVACNIHTHTYVYRYVCVWCMYVCMCLKKTFRILIFLSVLHSLFVLSLWLYALNKYLYMYAQVGVYVYMCACEDVNLYAILKYKYTWIKRYDKVEYTCIILMLPEGVLLFSTLNINDVLSLPYLSSSLQYTFYVFFSIFVCSYFIFFLVMLLLVVFS